MSYYLELMKNNEISFLVWKEEAKKEIKNRKNKLYFKNIPISKTDAKLELLFKKIENDSIKYDRNIGAVASLAKILYTIEGKESSFNLINKALNNDKAFKDIYLNMGKKLYTLGKLDDSSQYFTKILEIDNNNENALSFQRKIKLRMSYP